MAQGARKAARQVRTQNYRMRTLLRSWMLTDHFELGPGRTASIWWSHLDVQACIGHREESFLQCRPQAGEAAANGSPFGERQAAQGATAGSQAAPAASTANMTFAGLNSCTLCGMLTLHCCCAIRAPKTSSRSAAVLCCALPPASCNGFPHLRAAPTEQRSCSASMDFSKIRPRNERTRT